MDTIKQFLTKNRRNIYLLSGILLILMAACIFIFTQAPESGKKAINYNGLLSEFAQTLPEAPDDPTLPADAKLTSAISLDANMDGTPELYAEYRCQQEDTEIYAVKAYMINAEQKVVPVNFDIIDKNTLEAMLSGNTAHSVECLIGTDNYSFTPYVIMKSRESAEDGSYIDKLGPVSISADGITYHNLLTDSFANGIHTYSLNEKEISKKEFEGMRSQYITGHFYEAQDLLVREAFQSLR